MDKRIKERGYRVQKQYKELKKILEERFKKIRKINIVRFKNKLYQNFILIICFDIAFLTYIIIKIKKGSVLQNLLWLREQDLNLRPSGYEPDELPVVLHPASLNCIYYSLTIR